MARSIDQVELVVVAIVCLVDQPDRVGLDRNPALALEIHRIEDLLHHLALRKRARGFQQPVGERAFPMIDVRDDREIADEFPVHAV